MKGHANNGFTLVELLIVITIIGILAMIGYPSYQQAVTKARRADGQALLLNIMNLQERYYTENNTYTTDLTRLGYGSAGNIPSENGFYQASAAACNGSTIDACVIITGIAQGAQASDGDLSLDSHNVRTGNW